MLAECLTESRHVPWPAWALSGLPRVPEAKDRGVLGGALQANANEAPSPGTEEAMKNTEDLTRGIVHVP